MLSLPPGARLGTYAIVAPLGVGGMGEVYRARDPELERDVAIKVLPKGFATDRERLARFEREAKLLAALNHPNIATVHGFFKETSLPGDGQSSQVVSPEKAPDGEIHFLVMELVEGEDLSERIRRGPMPIEEALPIFIQIAEGLEAAHEKGIIHRDLKPANIKIGAEGRVKVLDFGLAKATTSEGSQGDLSQSPTMTAPATRAGVLLGTAAYMSPEQASGKPVDKRTDVWAFGVCLMEALSGKRVFSGDDAASTLAAVLRDELDFGRLPSTWPRAMRRLIARCLERDRNQRLRDLGDARLELEDALREEPFAASAPARPLPSLGIALGALVLSALLGGFLAWLARPSSRPAPVEVSRLTLALSDDAVAKRPPGLPFAVLSPDGRSFAYAASGKLWLRRLDSLESEPLRDTEGGLNPFFSPDGRQLAFFTSRALKRIDLAGGPAATICEISDGLTGAWGEDGTILFGTWGYSPLFRVDASGGTPRPFSSLETGEVDHDYADFLPGGEVVLFGATRSSSGWDRAEIVAQSLTTGERKSIIEDATYAVYTPTGHVVFGRGGGLFAVVFDADRLVVRGEPMPVVDEVKQSPFLSGIVQYSVAENGSLLYLRGDLMEPPVEPVWVDRAGNETPSGIEMGRYLTPSLSPDGTRLAFEVRGTDDRGLWVVDLGSGSRNRLTFDSTGAFFPTWTRDQEWLYYLSSFEGTPRLYRKRTDGSGAAELVVEAPVLPHSMTPDGTVLGWLFSERTSIDIVVVEPDPNPVARPLLATEWREGSPSVSPDGRWLAYQSDESGQPRVYVRPFPNVEGGKWEISRAFGQKPSWNPDGSELFYREGDRLVAVPVEVSGESLRVGAPRILFEGRYSDINLERDYAVGAGGNRFLFMKKRSERQDVGELILVENWFEELRRLVPID